MKVNFKNNIVTLEFPAKMRYLRPASKFGFIMAELVRTSTNSMDDRFSEDFELALCEAFSNAVRHRKEAELPHRILISFHGEQLSLTVTIKDQNPRFSLDHIPTPDFTNHPVSGYGIFIMKQVMDSVTYHRDEGKNYITLKKSLKSVRENSVTTCVNKTPTK